ncbi:MAG: hypothetical protein IJU84_09060 [Clostridia bacterium]|nr:hypothetical protein [Clostridia bacterium]
MRKGFLKIDAHVHSSGISKCSHVTVEQLSDDKMREGYDGMILVNHCQPWYYAPEEQNDFMRLVVKEYERAKKYGDNVGFRAFFGLEVTIEQPYNDWLLYCVNEKFLLSAPCLYKLRQKELFDLCEDNGIVLVQAHPFRNSGWGEPEYMRGVEINCTPPDYARAEETACIAQKRGLLLTCGTDYHGDARPTNGGIYLPENITSGEEVARYLLSAKNTELFLGEKDFTAPGYRPVKTE